MNQECSAVADATQAKGKVIKAFGNLLEVAFEGNIRQGEVAMVHLDGVHLKSEVIEINGNVAKIQVFEDTREIEFDTSVSFSGELLEAELGPGLLTSILDGLQNPLEDIAEASGFFLPRGIYHRSIVKGSGITNQRSKLGMSFVVEIP